MLLRTLAKNGVEDVMDVLVDVCGCDGDIAATRLYMEVSIIPRR